MSKWIPINQAVTSVSITHKFNKPFLNFLNTSDVEAGKIINVNRLPINELKGQAKKTIKKDDILFSEIRPKNKRYAYIDFDETQDYVVSTKLMVLRNINPEVDNKYFYYFLTNEHMLSILQNRAENRIGSFPQITFDLLSEYKIRVPDIKEQRQIASVLSSLDTKIEVNNRINAQLEAMAKTLYDYWFVQFDFPNKNGKPYKSSGGKMVYNEELRREIPEGWEVKKLIDFCSKIGDGIHGTPEYTENSDYYFINGNNLKNGFIETDSDTKKVTHEEFKKYFIDLNEGTILLSINGTLGNLALYIDEKVMLGKSSAYINCTGKNKPYCYQYLKLDNIQKKFWHIATGSTIKNLSLDSIKNLFIPSPNIDLIEKFYALSYPIEEKRKIVFKENQQLSQLRDWLLPMLMNGQVKVKETAVEEEILSMAAEESEGYGKKVELNIPANKLIFAKQVLGGKIVSLFKDDPNFTHIKFQKLQFLAEHIAEADLNLNYYFQAAGPYDNRFMHTIADSFRKSKWFNEHNYKFIPLEKSNKIEDYYQDYFKPVTSRLEQLFSLLANTTEAETEIIATIYAVWNNRIIQKQPIIESVLIEDFYNWSDRKHRYSKDDILIAIAWLKRNNMEPKGFGKLIKTAKNKG